MYKRHPWRLTGIKSPLVMFDFLSASRNTVETFFFTSLKVEITGKLVSKITPIRGANNTVELTQCISKAMRASSTRFYLWTGLSLSRFSFCGFVRLKAS